MSEIRPQPLRRIVTGHDASGRAIVTMDAPAPKQRIRAASGIVSTLVWTTAESPADIAGQDDRGAISIGTAPPERGSVFRVVDFPPTDERGISQEAVLEEMGLAGGHHGSRHPMMHRTRSIDYVVCMQGEIDMLLDESEVHMKAGDVMVQQGTNHAWVNRGTAVCRIGFVLIDAVAPPGIEY